MYIRFVMGHEQENHRKQSGIICEARFLADENRLLSHEEEIVFEVFDWLNNNIPCPPFESENYPISAVSYFKDTATDAIQMMRQLVFVLHENEMPVRIIKTENPGKIIYEDEYQVVVEEWNKILKMR